MTDVKYTFEQLNTLRIIANDLASPGNFDDALKRAMNQMSEHLGVERGTITIFRRDLDEIRTIAANKLNDEETVRARFAPGEGITGKVLNTGKAIIVPRIDEEPDFLNRSGARSNLDSSELAFICVPISYGNDIVGTLSADISHNGRTEFNTELLLLESVANLIASRVERRRVVDENRRLKEMESDSHDAFKNFIGSSDSIHYVRQMIARVADSKTTVLLTGETGTGKGLVAKAIHRASPRRDQPFVHLNCGAIPENLVESELFGHEKGAFTGAVESRAGRFEAAGHGTIFLDEINSLPQQAQVKLLKVIQDKQYEKVGSTKTFTTNARIITATNRDLEDEVENGTFRIDLFYRLNVFPINVPPLRNRGADIMLLTNFFIQKYAKEIGSDVERIDTPAIDLLMSYHWPGNVRELENTIERAVLLNEDGVITTRSLPPSL
ncbi:MAG: sigma 54-interacting transcriptional regulator, partial [Deltaproteobacteria bacterium]|nr:sigma 54-interacting transcriptional regulator [Deltaproteobacteria bacterium]